MAILERVKASGAVVRSLTEPIDTATSIGCFAVQILGAVAELERNTIRERSIAGQRAAIARGVKIGRIRSLPSEKEEELVDLYINNHYTIQDLARKFKIHPSSAKRVIYRVTKSDHSSLN